jgi:hypothetical protein
LISACGTKPTDVVFILDNSASVKRQNYHDMISFVKSVIREKEFNVGRGQNKTRVAAVIFANSARVG